MSAVRYLEMVRLVRGAVNDQLNNHGWILGRTDRISWTVQADIDLLEDRNLSRTEPGNGTLPEEAHMNAASGEMRSQMEMMMKQMEPHQTKIKENLTALERETAAASPNRARVLELTTELLKHLDAMSQMSGGHEGHKK